MHQPSSRSRDSINREIAQILRTDPRIREISAVALWPYLLVAVWDWGVILGAAFASEASGTWWTYPIACLLIAGRQHAFFALSHEAAHYRISNRRLWNDVFSNSFFAYPVLFDTVAYRQNHLKHHSHLNTDQDPDWVRKIPLRQWQFPMPLSYLRKNLPAFVLWYGPKEWILIMLQLARVLPVQNILQPESLRRVGIRAAYYGAAFAAISYFGLLALVAKYWVVPLVFVFPSLQRVRSVAEHFGLARTHDLNQTRNVMAPWYERMLFAPHNIHYHLDHHLISSVPFYNLPRLHRILLENATFRELAHENTSYVIPSARSLAKDLFAEGKTGSSAEAEKNDYQRAA